MTGFSHDVIVIGGGLMGSAAAWRLARDGRSVLVLDRYVPGHQHGSSHGSSRIIRLAYDTDDYVALARAAFDLWRELEAEAGETLMVAAGGLDIGMPDAEEVDEIRAAYERTGVAHEYLSADEIMARWPQFSLPEGMRGLYQADYSLLAADACVAALQRQAAAHGATFRWEEPVAGIAALPGGGVEVTTALGVHRGAKAILATGSWIAPMLRDLGLDLPLYVRKEFVCYVAARHQERFEPGRFPLVIHRFPGNLSLGSFFPSFGHTGVKALIDRLGAVLDPESEDREVDPVALESVRQYACRMIPDLTGEVTYSVACRYTMTPDEDFVIDLLPGNPDIVVASPCSGHGFKFGPVIGQVLADLATDGRTAHDISRFRIDREALRQPLPAALAV